MRQMLGLSLVMAIAGFALPFPWMSPGAFGTLFKVSLLPAACRLIVFIASLVKFRTRGLWLVLGLPLALYWPVWYLQVMAACHRVTASEVDPDWGDAQGLCSQF